MNKKEVHKIAPTLSKIGHKKHGFSVPDTYFNTIEDGVLAEINTSKINLDKRNYKVPDNYFKNIEDTIISKLKVQALEKAATNAVPEDYFETLEDRVLDKINDTSKVKTLKRISKYIAPIAIAASFLLIFLLKNTPSTITFDDLTTTEIEDFIDNDMLYYDAESIALVFPEVTLEDTNFISTLSDSEVENYLNENDLESLLLEN